MNLKKDQRVSFTRQHDRSHSLTGSVVEVKNEEVLIATDPDGTSVWANVADVKALPEEVATGEKLPREETASEEVAREAAEQAEEDAEDVQPRAGRRDVEARHKKSA